MEKTLSPRAAKRAAERAETKAANEAISAETKLKKEKEQRKAARGQAIYRKKLTKAVYEHKGDPLLQLECLFDTRNVPAAKGQERFVGKKRFDDIKESMRSFIQMLPNLRHGIQNLNGLGIKHVVALIRAWQETGISAGTIQGYISILRRFFCLIGKAKVLPVGKKLEDLLSEHGLALEGRCYIPDLQKGWRDLGHDPLEIIARIREAGHEVIACQLEMMLAWGLRDAESFGIRPKESEDETNGAGLAITRNTKGGKHRIAYYFKNDLEFAQYQREVLARAKALAAKHPQKLLSIPGLKLKQMKNRFYWVMRKFGITKTALGITAHGLRHQFACDLFRDVCGLPAPVLGLVDASVYKQNSALVEKAMLEVSRQLGHERKHISGAYVGSAANLGKTQRKRIDGWLDRLHPAFDAFRSSGAKEAWLVDTCSVGGLLRAGEPMRLAVRLDEGLSLKAATDSLDTLQATLERVTGMKVALTPWQRPEMPDPAFEVVFDPNQGRPQRDQTA